MRHVGFRVLLVLYHYLCYKNDVILNDQSSSYPVSIILRNEFQALSLTKLDGLNFISQTSIRYNHVLHGVRANSKPLQRKFSRTREPFYKMASC